MRFTPLISLLLLAACSKGSAPAPEQEHKASTPVVTSTRAPSALKNLRIPGDRFKVDPRSTTIRELTPVRKPE